jgi:hypothetical protein
MISIKWFWMQRKDIYLHSSWRFLSLVARAYGIKGMTIFSMIRPQQSNICIARFKSSSTWQCIELGLALRNGCKHGLTQSKLWPYRFVSCKYPFMNKKWLRRDLFLLYLCKKKRTSQHIEEKKIRIKSSSPFVAIIIWQAHRRTNLQHTHHSLAAD